MSWRVGDRIEVVNIWLETMESTGIPTDAQEILVLLLEELHGSLGADGWTNPQAMLRFIAGRLDHYAGQLHRVADAELLWPEEVL